MDEKRKPDGHKSCDWDLPAWVDVEDTLEGIRDTAAWMNLVDRVGGEEARRVLRARIIMHDENAKRQPRH
jgi:hypothetical protein